MVRVPIIRRLGKTCVMLLTTMALRAQAADEVPAEFVPPTGAKVAKRTGGAAVRCALDPALYVSILAPANTAGQTLAEQPTLYWYLSKPTRDPIDIAISDVRDPSQIVLEITLPGVAKGGLQRLDLSAHKAVLKPGGLYECVIEVVTSPTGRSRNASAACRIERLEIARTPKLPKSLSKPDLAASLAQRGVWFDYIATLLDAIHADADDKSLLPRLGRSLKQEQLIWKADGNIDELVSPAKAS